MTQHQQNHLRRQEKAGKVNFIFPTILLFLLLFLFVKTVKSQDTLRVNFAASLSSTHDGHSWPNAYASLQDAIENATSGTVVFVAQGTYKPSAYPIGTTDGSSTRDYAFTLKNGVQLYGGFGGADTTFATRNIAIHPTILSGDIGVAGDKSDNCYHVVLGDYINNSAVIDGFTIKDGNASDVIITTHTPSGHILPAHSGGGVFLNFASPNIVHCIIKDNDALYAGGGIVAQGTSNENIYSCVFTNNRVLSGTFGGGALYNYAHPSSPSSPVVTNSVFYNNLSLGAAGAIYTQYSNMTITNCTIFNNTAQLWGGGIYNEDSSNMIIRNCIIWGNVGNFITHPAGSDAGLTWNYFEPNVRFSLLQTYSTYSSNITTNPMFSNDTIPAGVDGIWMTADDGLRLQGSSPCIDAGLNSAAPSDDIIGTIRPIGINADMGAYEVATSVSSFTITSSATTGGSINPSGLTTVLSGSNKTYAITANSGYCINDVVVDGTSVGAVSSYTFTGITASHTIVASFVARTTPTISISSSSNRVCVGSTLVITANATNGGSAPMYNFVIDGVPMGSTASSILTTSSLSVGLHNIYCILTSNNPCQTRSTTTSAAINIAVGAATTLSTITGTTTLCNIGGSALLRNTVRGGVWESSNTSVATINALGMVTAVANGTAVITYTYTNEYGCVSNISTNVIVAAVAAVDAIVGPGSVCVGSSITLTSTTIGGLWSSAGRATITATGVVTGVSAGLADIRYTVANAFGCTAQSRYNVIVSAIPATPTISYAPGSSNPQRGAPAGSGVRICNSIPFTLRGTPAGGTWGSTGGITITPISMRDANVSTAGVTGTINITYTVGAAGCSNSRTITATAYSCRGISSQSTDNNQITVYPNPAHSLLMVNCKLLIGSGKIFITDLYGKQIKQQSLSIGANAIDVSTFAKGMYFVSVITENAKQTQKIIVE